MSEPSMSHGSHAGDQANSVAWFGKLPSTGDFVGRRMSHQQNTAWDNWMRAGMDELRNDAGGGWVNRFVQSPIWFFLCSSSWSGAPIAGAIAPSIDRVGRYYPITVVASATRASSTLVSQERLALFFSGARDALIDARRLPLSAEDLDARLALLPWPFERRMAHREPSLIDDILSDLESASSEKALIDMPRSNWRAVPESGDPTSVWWISPTHQFHFDEVTHHGMMDRALFTRLFRHQAGLIP